MTVVLPNSEPAGIRKSWIKGLNKLRVDGDQWREFMRGDEANLWRYVETGGIRPGLDPTEQELNAARPPFARCECNGVGVLLLNYGLVLEYDREKLELDSGEYQLEAAARVFSAIYPFMLVKSYMSYMWPVRFHHAPFENWRFAFPYVGLGMVFGCRTEAATLVRMIALIYERDPRLRPADIEPLGFFMLRLMVDFLGETPPRISDYNRQFPTYLGLFDIWRDPDPQRIAPLCQAALDLHTHMGSHLPSGRFGEFNVPVWLYTPIEILLLFRLRQWLGLENPRLDHLLMTGPYASLPPEATFSYDPMVAQVLERWRQDGFDEAKIIDCVLNDRYPLPQAITVTS